MKTSIPAHFYLTLFVLLLLGTTSCYPKPSPLPTIGPISSAGGETGFLEFHLAANTSCVQVGELITFTLDVTSVAAKPFALTNQPLLDIVLKPRNWIRPEQPPTRRWSETPMYPKDITPLFQPGEHRRYTWEWVAEPVFGEQGILGVNAEAVAYIIDQGVVQDAGANLYVGVNELDIQLDGGRGIRCAELALQ